jgi:hypothetical protein
VQLQLVRRTRESRDTGTKIEHALDGPSGGCGVAELGGRVREHAVRLHAERLDRQRLLGVAAGGGEVVPGVRQRASPTAAAALPAGCSRVDRSSAPCA